MEITYLETISSTQIFLENALKNGRLNAPIALYTFDQTGGIGSRDNRWEGVRGNLAFSFALPIGAMPTDLPQQSASLYFGFLFKETLAAFGSAAWMKWPNDLYIDDKKIGGVITKRFYEYCVCGIGLNIHAPMPCYGAIDIAFDTPKLLAVFLDLVEKRTSWDTIFSLIDLEYNRNRAYAAHIGSRMVPLMNSQLDRDGSIIIDGERVFSER